MRRFLVFFIALSVLFLLAVPSRAAITKVQALEFACTASPCVKTIASTGSGNLLVIVQTGGVGDTITAISCTSTCGTWVHCTACESSDSSAGAVDLEYVLSSNSGATSVSVTMTGATSLFFFEFSTTLPPFLVNTGATPQSKRDQTTAVTSIAGVALTLSAVNAVNVQGVACGGTCSSITTYAGIFDATNGNGAASLINTTSGTAPTWTSTSGRAALNAASWQETPALAVTSMPPAVY